MTLQKSTLQNWSTEVLTCRSFGHQWKPMTARRQKGGFIAVLSCARNCGAEKRLTMDNTGRPTGSRISYPNSYLTPEGTGRLDANDKAKIRLLAISVTGVFQDV